MSDYANNITSALINTQVPEFVRNEHQTFVKFLEYYYKFLERDGQQSYVTKNFVNFLDIDGINKDIQEDYLKGDDYNIREVSDYHDFLQKMYDNFIKFIPDDVLADRTLIVKHAKEFYRSRGSEKSVRFLIRALFNKEISFYYPKQDILRSSDGKWFIEKSLKVKDVAVNNVANTIAVSNFQNKTIKGLTSNATALVERVDTYFDKGALVYELKLSGIYKEFQNAEKIFAYFTEEGNDKYLSANLFSGVITAVTINDGGTNYTEGTSVPITSNGSGAKVVISKVTKGTIQKIVPLFGGAGFKIDNAVVISGSGSGANANVISVLSDGYYHPNSYNVVWSTIALEASTNIGNLIYSNLNSSNVNTTIANAMSYFTYANCGPAVECLVITGGNNYVPPLSLTISANSFVTRLGILGRMNIVNGGSGYASNDKIEFINLPGSTGSGAYANVANVDANGSITEVHFIEQTGQIIGGSGYDWQNLPLANVVSGTGNGANIVVTAVLGHNEQLAASNSVIGRILEMSVISGGTGYTDNPVLRLDTLGDGTANASLTVVAGAYSYPGRYINDDGHISSFNFLEDRDYYQNFSYVVKVDETINKYRKVIKDLIHPAGMKLFGEYLTTDDAVTETNTNVVVTYANTVSNTKFYNTLYRVQDYIDGVFSPVILGGNLDPEIINATYLVNNANQSGTFLATGNNYLVYSVAHGYAKDDYVYFSIYSNAAANLVNGTYKVTYANTNYLRVTNPYTVVSNTGNLQLYNPKIDVSLSRSSSLKVGDNVHLIFRTTDPFLANGLYHIYGASSSSRFKVLHPQPNAIIALVTPTVNTTISYFNATSSGEIAANGTLIVTPTLGAGQSIPYSAGVLPDVDVNTDIEMVITESINIGPLWSGATVSHSAAPGEENILMGVGTFFNYLNIGDRIEISGTTAGDPEYKVVDIDSNTIILLSNAVPNTISTSVIYKSYKIGDVVKLTGKGVTAGGKRTVTATAANLTFDLKETFSQEVSANVTYKLADANTSTSNNNLSSVIVTTNTTIVTLNDHGFSEGDRVYILVTSGDTANIANGYYVVANVPSVGVPNTFNIMSQKPMTTNGIASIYTKNNEVVIVNHAASNGNTVYLTFSGGDQTNTTNGIYSSLKISADKFRVKTRQPSAANSNVRVYYSTNLYSNIHFTRDDHSLSTGNNVRIEFLSTGISNGIFTIKTAYSSNTYNIYYNANTYVNKTTNTLAYSSLSITPNIAMEGSALVALYK